MSESPQPVSPSPASRFLLPALAVLTVAGVIMAGMLFTGENNTPSSKEPPANQAQPRVTGEAQAPSRTDSAAAATPQNAAPAMGQPAPVNASQTATVSAPAPVPAQPASGGEDSLIDPQPESQPLAPGEPASAQVTVNGAHTPLLVPNQTGEFPRVYLAQSGQASVQVSLPEAAPGEQVIVGVEDGGRFADGKPVQALTLDENRQVSFQFQANAELGRYRIRVRHGAESKIVQFWAGDRTIAINR